MIRMNVNRILPLMLLLVLFASCSRKYKVEGVSSVTSLDGTSERAGRTADAPGNVGNAGCHLQPRHPELESRPAAV